ncbi:glycoside hydrolase family 6 protein [Streptomyces marincola]|uniref:glycoside hydrolase family 6 protein n=1 Tax=Streptomyces marincola TaxID=2878388 RepID=UPI001CF1D2E0|nr:glycoside hydrolase family 6 protein [Streptomyces marincola]UCM90666.1 glycoside hydrolase family 6 protein [Streptomyces marincola]
MRTPRAAQPPDHRTRPAGRPRAALLIAAGAALATAFTWGSVPAAHGAQAAGLPDGTEFHDYPLQVHAWVEANPGDPRQPLIADRIAAQPQAVWFSHYEPGTVTRDAAAVTSAAEAAGEVPVLVSYMIPNRDCGGASAGGAPDFPSYLDWVEDFAAGLGSGPAAVILEPDSLALTTCLDGAERAERFSSLARAADLIHAANPEARVYFDAGHSAWHEPAAMAATLTEAGVLESGDGIYSNVSNYRATGDEVAFAQDVLAALGDDSLRAVIDTSRNGNGPAGSEWCDPPGRLVGENPTADTGNELIDAFLWVKPPGELDGCAGPAGQFSPEMAHQLAGG